jgi:hypothetical protein
MKVKQLRLTLSAASKVHAKAGDRESADMLRRLASVLADADNEHVGQFVARVTKLRRQSKVMSVK